MTEGKVTILVVDDEEHVQKLLQRVLEEAGYNILMAGDGQEALDIGIFDSCMAVDISRRFFILSP
ncbi:MAG: hypothetical protein Q7J73_03885 [Dehalococcoidales bacterium]|nr:hypothetical protein [Dehalococcoidales bacterium]